MIAIKDKIALMALRNAPANGWSMAALREAARDCGQDAQMADALFAEGICDASRHVADYFDRDMMVRLRGIDSSKLRIRERIAKAVMTRLEAMAPYRDGLRCVIRPSARILWRSADAIWRWAGDTSSDYNHYTKRGLLSGVMASTLLFWFQDSSPRFTATQAFLERRIETVLKIGQMLGKKKVA